MSEHFTKNTESVTRWCNFCNRATQHAVSTGRLGRCLEHDTSQLTKKQVRERAKRNREAQNLRLFSIGVLILIWGAAAFVLRAQATLTVTSVAPMSGPPGSGLTIHGTGFIPGATAYFTCPAGSGVQYPVPVTFESATALVGQAPALPPSTVYPVSCDVTVTNPATLTSPPASVTVHLNS